MARSILLLVYCVALLLVCSAAAWWKRGTSEAFELVNGTGETLICTETESMASTACRTRTVQGGKLCLGSSCIQGSDLDRITALLNAPPPAPAPVYVQAQAPVPPAPVFVQAPEPAPAPAPAPVPVDLDLSKPFRIYHPTTRNPMGLGIKDQYTGFKFLQFNNVSRVITFKRVDNPLADPGYYGLVDVDTGFIAIQRWQRFELLESINANWQNTAEKPHSFKLVKTAPNMYKIRAFENWFVYQQNPGKFGDDTLFHLGGSEATAMSFYVSNVLQDAVPTQAQAQAPVLAYPQFGTNVTSTYANGSEFLFADYTSRYFQTGRLNSSAILDGYAHDGAGDGDVYIQDAGSGHAYLAVGATKKQWITVNGTQGWYATGKPDAYSVWEIWKGSSGFRFRNVNYADGTYFLSSNGNGTCQLVSVGSLGSGGVFTGTQNSY